MQREIVFSEKDKENAEYLTIYASKILGDAKPDTENKINTFTYPFTVYPYYKDVFEIVDTDEEYGLLRGEQIGNYSLNGEPKWGNSNIASANYIENAFFTPLETYESIFKTYWHKINTSM
ncbi:hypothetical protein [Apibacter adventoris]|uniref:hypothetical protein n=1 Tax=Apibacter adventoris TaxID=1679466 RepID=UPI000CF68AE0|nr:hypothetical protein [Apibacter adventoris]PQL94661.1 hypothetical protein C4S76_04305 [Apibacter adventoris]